jgi:hypothetical protein
MARPTYGAARSWRPYAWSVRTSAVVGALLAASALVALLLASGRGPASASTRAPEAYWLGASFEGLPLTAMPGRSFIYGDCDPGPDSGCAPPLEVQNWTSCERNPVALDVLPRRVFSVRGGGLAAAYPGPGSIDVGTGRRTVAVFGGADLAGRAVLRLRRRSAVGPPRRLPRPRYPSAVLRELKRVTAARRRFGTANAIARATGLTPASVRMRLRVARLLGARALRGVRAPTRSVEAVERDRQAALAAYEFGERKAARDLGVTRSQLRRMIRRVRGLAAYCPRISARRRSDTTAVKRTLGLAVRAAIQGGSLRRACRFATPRGKRRLIAGFSWFDRRDYDSCEQVLRAQIRDPAGRDILENLRRRTVISVLRVRGDRARATVGYQEGNDVDSAWFSLRKVDGKWRIANSEAIPPPCQCE